MADVFLARDLLLDRPVAVKVLFSSFATDPSFVERFRREAQAAANLSHPNIVNVFDWGEEQGTYFIVMEYVEGRSLAEILKSEGRLHPDRAAEIATDVAAALGFAHRNGLVHRDVKPGNVLVSPDGHVKVADFGIATAMAAQGSTESDDPDLTRAGMVMGTATYFSPEQAQGKAVDPRSDIYSLGVVLYEMLTGQPPFTGDSPVGIAYRHVTERPVAPKTINPDLAASINAITLKAIAKKPTNRYPSAEDLRSDLRRYREGQHQTAGGAPPRPTAAGAAPAAAAGPGSQASSQPSASPPIIPVQPAVPAYQEPTYQQPAVDATQAIPVATGVQQQPVDRAEAERVQRAHIQAQEEYHAIRRRGEVRRTAVFVVVLLALIAVLGFLGKAFIDTLGGSTDGTTQDAVSVVVPSVKGMTFTDASNLIVQEGLEVGEVEFVNNEEVPVNVVFGQSPEALVKVAEGAAINLTVSGGETEQSMPNVVGLTLTVATEELTGRGLKVTQTAEQSEEPRDTVIAQVPAPDTALKSGDEVQIVVSLGPAPREIPDVKGKTLEEASDILEEAGFKNRREQQEPSSSTPVGSVSRTDPAKGTVFDPSEELTVFISSGVPESTVPSVVALSADTAANILAGAGFQVSIRDELLPANDPNIGRVISQSPGEGSRVSQNSTVTIVVGRAGAPPATGTQPPQTQPPQTQPPQTQPPQTQPPQTQPPQTQPPGTAG